MTTPQQAPPREGFRDTATRRWHKSQQKKKRKRKKMTKHRVRSRAHVKPWERQRTESAKAFHAFVLYRDMGPNRTQLKVSKELGHSTGGQVGRWSRKHDWVERVRLWDNHQDQLRAKVAEEEIRKMFRRQANVFGGGFAKLAQSIPEWQVDPSKPVDAARAMEIMAKGEIRARGLPTERVAQEHSGTVHQTHSLEELTDEELEAIVAGEDPADDEPEAPEDDTAVEGD